MYFPQVSILMKVCIFQPIYVVVHINLKKTCSNIFHWLSARRKEGEEGKPSSADNIAQIDEKS